MLIEPRRLSVTHPRGKYEVLIGHDIWPLVADTVGRDRAVAIVTDDNVGPLYASQMAALWSQATVIELPAGETHKNLDSVRYIYDEMFAAGLDRQSAVVALGGGVINDMAGFVAATFMRGIDFVTCPTSLLAMVDAGVGGKTGVDMPQGKNLVGAFKQPLVVGAAVESLHTLPAEEFAAGMAEVIKHGLLNDTALLTAVRERDWSAVGKTNEADADELHALQTLVTAAIRVKRDVVQEDPFEGGRRALLNLGHTFGHAIEQVSRYEVRHGEGVAMGLVCAAHLSAALGYCSAALQVRIERLLTHVGLPIRIPDAYTTEALIAAMQTDKKKAGRQLRFILLRDIEGAFITAEVPREKLAATLREMGAAA